jgi:exopolysaccharide production protein ExoZ
MLAARKEYYYGIDLIRFAAALMVSFFHIGFSCWASPTSGGSNMLRGAYTLPELAPVTWFGWVGVEIFFVISGFVITSSAEGTTPAAFLKSRALRLYPAVWICATGTALLLVALGLFGSPWRYMTSILLVPTGPWIDGQYWTLGVEIIFYSCVFCFLLIGQIGLISRFAALLAIWSGGFLIALSVLPDLEFLTVGRWRLLLLNYGIYFSLGIFIREWSAGRLRAWMWPAVAICLVGAFLEIRHHAVGMGERVTLSPVALADRWHVAVAVFVAAVIAIVLSVRFRSLFYRLPTWVLAGLRSAGLATYPLYLLHFSVGIAMTRFLVLAGVPAPWALLLTVATLTWAALVVATRIEPAIRRGLRSILDRVEVLIRQFVAQRQKTPAASVHARAFKD